MQHLYKLVVQTDSQPLAHARFLLHYSESHDLFIENSRGNAAISRFFCSSLHAVELENLDSAEGVAKVFLGDHCIVHTRFRSSDRTRWLHLSDITPTERRVTQAGGQMTVQYALETRESAGLLDVFVVSPSLLALALNDRELLARNANASFTRVLIPAELTTANHLTLRLHSQLPSLVHASVFSSLVELSLALVGITRFEQTLFLTSLHHESVTINALYFAPCSSFPRFDVARLQNAEWVTLASVPAHSASVAPSSCILPFNNLLPSSQYRVQFNATQLPHITPFFAPSPLWTHQDSLTPGLVLSVYERCFNWLVLGEREMTDVEGSVRLMSHGLFFDWTNEILFGVPDAAHTLDDDSEGISEHLQLQSCDGNMVPLVLSHAPHIPTILIYDGAELVSAVPGWLRQTTVTVCLERNRVFRVKAKEEGELRVRSDHWDAVVHMAPNQPGLLSTYAIEHPKVSFSSSRTAEPQAWWERVVDQTTPAFLHVEVVAEESFQWEGDVSTILFIHNAEERSVLISGLGVRGAISEVYLECQKSCRILFHHPCNESQVDLQVLFPPSFPLSSLTFSLLLFPTPSSLFPLPLASPHISLLSSSSSNSPSFSTLLKSSSLLSFSSPSTLFSLTHLSFFYSSSTTDSIFFQLLYSSVVHTAVLPSKTPNQWHLVNLTLPSHLLTPSFSLVFKSSRRNTVLSLRSLRVSSSSSIRFVTRSAESERSDVATPIHDKLETILRESDARGKDKSEAPPAEPPRVCEEEWDPKNHVLWKKTPAVRHVFLKCEAGGRVHRFCDSDGTWGSVEGECVVKKKDVLHMSIQRVGEAGSSPSKSPAKSPSNSPSQSSSKVPSKVPAKPRKCPATFSDTLFFPATAPAHWSVVRCPSPLFGEVRRFCNEDGAWAPVEGSCRTCPPHSFPLSAPEAKEAECVQCPSGSAFLRGNPLSAIKCYGQYYSEGGVTDCQLCHGVTRGTKKNGNFACKECEGAVVGIQCVQERCEDGVTSIGSLRYLPCEAGRRGVMTQMCRYNKGVYGVFGPTNTEGCCIDSLGSFTYRRRNAPLGRFPPGDFPRSREHSLLHLPAQIRLQFRNPAIPAHSDAREGAGPSARRGGKCHRQISPLRGPKDRRRVVSDDGGVSGGGRVGGNVDETPGRVPAPGVAPVGVDAQSEGAK